MAHFAKLDENNIVLTVIVGIIELGDDEDAHCRALGGVWKRTSYNMQAGEHMLGGIPFRKNYAGFGYKYDATRDAFISPQPFPSWVLNEDSCIWESPTPYPSEGGPYAWNESTFNWDAINV